MNKQIHTQKKKIAKYSHPFIKMDGFWTAVDLVLRKRNQLSVKQRNYFIF